MTIETNSPETRISNWTRATGTQPGRRAIRTAVIAGDESEQCMLEAGLATHDCDVVSIAPLADAYSTITRIAPDVVVVCLHMDEPEGFHLLSMLTMDRVTSAIALLIHTATREAAREESDPPIEGAYVRNDVALRLN